MGASAKKKKNNKKNKNKITQNKTLKIPSKKCERDSQTFWPKITLDRLIHY